MLQWIRNLFKPVTYKSCSIGLPRIEALEEPVWSTYHGERIPVSMLTDNHIYNIIKFSLALNRPIPVIILFEAIKREHILPQIADQLVAADGYKSPSEIGQNETQP